MKILIKGQMKQKMKSENRFTDRRGEYDTEKLFFFPEKSKFQEQVKVVLTIFFFSYILNTKTEKNNKS